ncbi:MAG: ABC transporter permease [Myxococcales bacterium]|nr:ABC transporter permease [Myxococcales bacterium]
MASSAASEGSGSSAKNVITIFLRELGSFFNSLVAYVVLGVSMLALGVYFFLMQSGGFWQVDRATMARMFDFLPWALSLIVVPLVTMRAISEEKRSGTLELLITLPVKDSEVILGKWLAALAMCTILLGLSLLYPIAMFKWPWHLGPLDWGPIWAGYLGLVLLSAAGTAFGIMMSSYTESQIIAFFVTAVILAGLLIIGSVAESMRGPGGEAIAFVSFSSRFAPFARGLIDTRSVVFFASVSVMCLLVAFRNLESRKWS